MEPTKELVEVLKSLEQKLGNTNTGIGWKVLAFHLRTDISLKFKEVCMKEGKSMTRVIRSLIEGYIEKSEKNSQ